ncbi:glycoside hydrolase family 43 protein [Desmospora activa]|uniref:Beta-xylosidase n=1 Tax=Desmospora activa DSM 45169 TaxID=1121389 RepID=A0A2T4Z3W9_9BACL|nr:glycoside hydrolase 43 family protein [Desmospora activa]PTM56577.1 beta-xylosidase [Desmospora activa DSM 45169]
MNSNGIWIADNNDGTYRNPILFADYSDPDVIRVGRDYFMVASSFTNMPGIPVLHSRDLVNWQLINYVFERLPFARYDQPRHGEGAWAPSIRYHNGRFWVFFATPDEGIFMSTTDDPFKKWSPLHQVKKGKGWIDPCPYWDEDGQAYLVNAFAKSRIGFKSVLGLSRMAPDGTKLLDEGAIIFDGNASHPTIEGPKLYKRNGYYYIFAPAGGVPTGWQTILRATNIDGPYEDKIVLHQGDTDINGPHQGGWIETESGESWFVHFQDRGAYGRIVHLQPVQWEEDWPLMGKDSNGDGIGEPVLQWKKPDTGQKQPLTAPPTDDDFTGERLGLQWQWQANPQRDWYTLGARESHLRLHAICANTESGYYYHDPNLLTQKFPAPSFQATAKLSFHPKSPAERAGLAVMGEAYGGLYLQSDADGLRVVRFSGQATETEVTETVDVVRTFSTAVGTPLYLRVTVEDGAVCRFSISEDGQNYQPLGASFVATKGKWVGAKLAIFCISRERGTDVGFADYDWFQIEAVKRG